MSGVEKKEIIETKNFDEFFDELNDMANFKNFGETIKDKEFIDNPVIAYEELKAENARLKSCLQEIKTIAEKYDNLTYPVSSIGLSHEILQKISEVE